VHEPDARPHAHEHVDEYRPSAASTDGDRVPLHSPSHAPPSWGRGSDAGVEHSASLVHRGEDVPRASGDDIALPQPPQAASERAEPAPTLDDIAHRYGDTVYTMAYRLTGDRDEARDLTQDVFVRVYRNLDRYRPGTFEGWLYRITKNLFLDRMRRRARVRMEPLPDEEWRQPPEPDPGPAERVEAGVLRGDLETALQQLPPTFRAAVVLCDVQGLSYEEIAESTGWPIGTVRSRIHRGRRALRQLLERQEDGRG
jgi:RNA polymerase sigma-70 factor, ECF subfamily